MISFETPYPWAEAYTEAFAKSQKYEAYYDRMRDLAEAGRTTGDEQSESLVNFTALNFRRIKRWTKTLDLPVDVKISLSHLETPVSWLVISESWCGDAAHALPVMQAMASEQPLIDFRVVLRDENPALMDQFLTDGARSIPKLISTSSIEGELLGTWGARPEVLTRMVNEEKARAGKLSPEFKEGLQAWYNTNKGVDTARELLRLLPLE